MAIDLDARVDQNTLPPNRWPAGPESAWEVIKLILEPVASLRLTVVLFALSIGLILAGTFAQVDKDIWEVIGLYFRCWFAWIPLSIFFPPSFVPELPGPTDEVTAFGRTCIVTIHWLKEISGTRGLYYPGGNLIGMLLGANLLAAHTVRFKAVATGKRLAWGLGAIAAGIAVTGFVISAAGNTRAFQTEPWVPYPVLWRGYEGLLGLLCLGALYATVMLLQRPAGASGRVPTSFMVAVTGLTTVGLAVLLSWLLINNIRPSDPSMRILWQLTQGTTAAAALMAGCAIVFGRRAGIVLLHGGIGLMMYYELHVALTAIETQMNLAEGETTSFVHDIRTFELAVIDKTQPNEDRVAVIPRSLLKEETTVDDPQLPVRVEILSLLANSHLRAASFRDKNLATTGLGIEWYAEPKKAGTGTDTDSKVDMAAAYVRLIDRDGNRPLGTYLVGMLLSMSDEMDTFQVGGKTYQLALRPKRYYKTYQFQLKDVRKEDYLGTSTPRNYASTVQIQDPTRNVEESKTIWMNNPLRFANETFYQSGYFQERGTGVEHTTLSVVANSGWMMPYVSCMLVAVGMMTHFLILLVRFLMRGDVAYGSESARRLAARLGMETPLAAPTETPEDASWGPFIAAAAVFLLVGGYVLSRAVPPRTSDTAYHFYEVGQIPVVQDGRSKPLDSAAYSALLAISNRTFVEIGHGKEAVRIPAIEWLMDVIAETEAADNYEVFRIENLEVQETIGVKKREGMRYSRKEIQKNEDAFRTQVQLARSVAEKDRKDLSVFQRKILELDEKVSTYDALRFAFGLHHRIGGDTQEDVIRSFQAAIRFEKMLVQQGHPVFAVGPQNKDQTWKTFAGAWLENVISSVRDKKDPDPTVAAWDAILSNYAAARQADAKLAEQKKKAAAAMSTPPAADSDEAKAALEKRQKFNAAVTTYLGQLDRDPPYELNLAKTRFEAYFNAFQPFTLATRLYVVGFVLVALGWLAYPQYLNRMAFSLLSVTLLLHTFALIGRIYISGRPPVTNLYSSAVFIGWGCVALGLLLEKIFKLGVGNVVAAVNGYATLLIADGLALKGDTFTVLQAVLDTQFWLATHVTTITLGYATTYLAGMLGVMYVLRGVLTPTLTPRLEKELGRMIYGTVCFSIFFSFVGTVLGGLWADDSWGRFWGWDPKENGALIIVLWNALVLHARWGGMVKNRGMAVLAIAGNIFVSWSWWGVNELGAGLHSYGFTEGTVIKLGLFVLSQLVLVAIGLVPRRIWVSRPAA